VVDPVLVSIITPTLNAAAYFEKTLESVRAQEYTPIEHLVVDGGSTDATIALAIASGARVIEAPGLNQAAAINRGVEEASGDVVIVLNADDVLYPDAVSRLARGLANDPDCAAVYGDAVHIDANDRVVSSYPTREFSPQALSESCIICHPASAVRRSAFRSIGGLDGSFEVAMDYDFWIRLAEKHRVSKIEGLIAASRMHLDNKTLRKRGEGFLEAHRTLLAHFGYLPYTWVFAYTMWWLFKDRNPFFEPKAATRTAVLASLVVGLVLNWRQPARYVADWYGHRAVGR
jgi:glycosyltransferase involved in cell wall biosynthesis